MPLDVEESKKVQKAIISSSRNEYAIKRTKVEGQMEVLFSGDELTKEKKQASVIRRKESSATPSKGKLQGL